MLFKYDTQGDMSMIPLYTVLWCIVQQDNETKCAQPGETSWNDRPAKTHENNCVQLHQEAPMLF